MKIREYYPEESLEDVYQVFSQFGSSNKATSKVVMIKKNGKEVVLKEGSPIGIIYVGEDFVKENVNTKK